MRKYYDATIEKLKNCELSGGCLILALVVAMLCGVIIGLCCSVKGDRYFGCYNGSTFNTDDFFDDDDFEEE